jgi:hypothetical protein
VFCDICRMWPCNMFEPCLITICFPYFSSGPGICVESQELGKWLRMPLSLLACMNFLTTPQSFQPCQRVWCKKCYTCDPDVTFYVKCPVDDRGISWK